MGSLAGHSLPLPALISIALQILVLFLRPAAAYSALSEASLSTPIFHPGADLNIHEDAHGGGALLAPLLIPRVPGTPGSAKAQAHFAEFFRTQLPEWQLVWHNTTSRTPATGSKDVPFVNLIFRRDPPWASSGDVARLTLVAHYDSLYRPEGFIGATDSAASCAMLMHVARAVDEALTRKWDAMKASGEAGDGLEEEKGVQIVLLDGEEAWVEWTDDDSLYGSRALAQSWEKEMHTASSTFKNQLESVSLFVLLDLLGSPDPHVPSWFGKTHWAYQHLATVEEQLRKHNLLETKPKMPFLPDMHRPAHEITGLYVLDDHVPFLQRGVDILHLIPTPFPPVWHTMDDDAEHLDLPTLRDWAKIMAVFAAEWMELDGFLPEERRSQGHGEKSEL